MLEKLGGITVITQDLFDGFVVIQNLTGRHLGLYHRKRDTVNHQHNVKPDVLVTRKLELDGYNEDVVPRTCVNETNNLSLFAWIQDDAFFSLNPVKELAVAVDIV